jgi:hypothetical protein
MTTLSSALRQLTLLALTTFVFTANALAASPNASTQKQAQARYRQDMAVCNSGQSNQSAATCRRDAGSALAEAKRGTLHTNAPQYQRNALLRCAVHQGDDRVACEARIVAQGDVTTETQAGGLLRKSITVEPAQ